MPNSSCSRQRVTQHFATNRVNGSAQVSPRARWLRKSRRSAAAEKHIFLYIGAAERAVFLYIAAEEDSTTRFPVHWRCRKSSFPVHCSGGGFETSPVRHRWLLSFNLIKGTHDREGVKRTSSGILQRQSTGKQQSAQRTSTRETAIPVAPKHGFY